MTAPLVSVIVTSYNRAAYLRESVDSILNQTFRDFEIIIVDDGSGDDSRQIGMAYAARYDNVFFIAQENAGLASARNTGVRQARGEFVAFQDDDDISHPKRLELQLALLRKHPDVAVCISNKKDFRMQAGALFEIPESIISWREEGQRWISPCCMIRRAIYLQLGGFRPYFRILQDRDFFFLLSEHHRYIFMDECLYFHRMYPRYSPSKSYNLSGGQPLERFRYKAAAFISAYCRKNSLPDPVALNEPMEVLLLKMGDLPDAVRSQLLYDLRTAGRNLMRVGQDTDDEMIFFIRYLRLLASGQCWRQAGKFCRRLIFHSLRYGRWSSALLFIRLKL